MLRSFVRSFICPCVRVRVCVRIINGICINNKMVNELKTTVIRFIFQMKTLFSEHSTPPPSVPLSSIRMQTEWYFETTFQPTKIRAGENIPVL